MPPTQAPYPPDPYSPPAPTTAQPVAAAAPAYAPPPPNHTQAPAKVSRKHEHWNWGAGIVVSLFVVAGGFALQQFMVYIVNNDLQASNSIDTQSFIILASGAAVALIAMFLLTARSAGAVSVLALLAGLTTGVGSFWNAIRDWDGYMDARWEAKVAVLAIALIPVVLGILAFGLRRKDRRSGVTY